jgi:cytoskeletal protein RodZ
VQRELKIKASYIAAIENADPSAFETPGFIAGYVRSYARYLGLDAEWAFRAFCAESGFETSHGMSGSASARRASEKRVAEGPGAELFANSAVNFAPKGEAFLSRVEPGAIGSTAVLLALIGVIGYGGFAVLKEVQRVDVVPVEQTPALSATLDPLADAVAPPEETDVASNVTPKDPDALDRLYRPQALDVPVLVARDGPIASLDPASVGALAPGELTTLDVARRDNAPAAAEPIDPADTGVDAAVAAAMAGVTPDALPQGTEQDGAPAQGPRVLGDNPPEVVMVAVRPSWVRVRAADGTVLYEKIMQGGDTFVLPQTEEPATLRTGESGAIYFAVNGQTYGPAGGNGQITSNLALSATNLSSTYEVADLERDSDLQKVVAELNVAAPEPGAE